jgi:hypothetical protein
MLSLVVRSFAAWDRSDPVAGAGANDKRTLPNRLALQAGLRQLL